ncbi:GSCOCT00014101001.2-RA-CDS [Cotesia congregata]|uniref:Olfactory receptor 167 n=1 Tax=Cotesia congregata TaxID=51543 RepID=A0A8J2HBH2_COTCN|nr:GSCOCT00014101001.2-RA-CDS [Cotesia congregata]CAG5092688.1 olfactory receptor 167 [Cotesia congregata]
MMFQICAKLNILKYRFKMTIKQLENTEDNKLGEKICGRTQKQLIANWVESHIKLLNLFNSVNTLFTSAIFIHYIVNSILLCTIAMFATFENLRNVIFDTKWYTTKKAVQKSMIIIMSQSIIPVEFVSGYFVSLSLDSFKKIIKLSYTIYNVLE